MEWCLLDPLSRELGASLQGWGSLLRLSTVCAAAALPHSCPGHLCLNGLPHNPAPFWDGYTLVDLRGAQSACSLASLPHICQICIKGFSPSLALPSSVLAHNESNICFMVSPTSSWLLKSKTLFSFVDSFIHLNPIS